MDLKQLCEKILTPGRREAVESAVNDNSCRRISLYGLAGSSAPMLMSALPSRGRPMLVIGDSLDDAGYLYHDLSRVLGESAVLMFPSGYKRSIKYGQVDPPSQIMRTEVLNHWFDDPSLRYVVTYPEALAEHVATRDTIEAHTLQLAVGSTVDLAETEKWLRENGFQEVDYVYDPGHFAVRGSILDIYGYSCEEPFRIDFFGDEIESIRTFNIETQLSESKHDRISITSNVSQQGKGESLLDYIPADTLLWVRDADYTLQRIEAISTETFSDSALIADEGDKDALKHVVEPDRFAESLKSMRQIRFSAAANADADASAAIDFGCTPQGIYHKNFDLISDSLLKFIGDGYTVYILSDSEKQIERLRAIFEDRGDDIKFTPVISTIHEGFVDHVTKACIFTDHQIFDRFHKYNLKSDRSRSGKLALSLKELGQIEVGDYVVHVDHGVGRFGGLIRTEVNGRMQEMIKLVYLNNDILLVSIHSLHKLAKYRGKEGVEPRINRLGSGAWGKMKERTKSKLKDIARDLIKLYAARKDEKGFAYSPDSYLQQELEASFIYEDTPDQLTATQAVKNDMESARPMDRLICGDVGFGKTEIAIRAAFKAATDNKQTAVLVPTTVLAYQHFNTFKNRLKEFPVRVDYLSRARSAKEVKQIKADLAEGKIDILIGTHKLIGKDIKFKDLGLLIVDEEQKFGVAVKEKLKQMKVNVDTLTMSATPIPRTLQFSLMGARDLSAITTPPANRYPILTSVNAINDDIMLEAVNFEMSRNGQVFIVNHRIEGLYELEAMINRLVPDARTIVAHGQMPPEKLERAIIDFANHDYDVLLATTIIESGIDMPNVNTIVINNAQNFGLSELHQLRGRVGRSSRKAFCYLLVPPHIPLNPVARRRLQAIESFSELGSGIHIAMQDLDIRGAGNLLGAEQSGFIADLGYETYQRILKEAVLELKNEEFSDTLTPDDSSDGQEFVADCVIESDMELLLPPEYVPQESERISLYKELDGIERELDLQQFKLHLEDRFGKIPKETAELLRIPRLRYLARRLGIEKVVLKQGSMYIYFVDDNNKAYYQSPMFGRLLNFLQANPRRCRIREKNGRRSFAIADVPTVEEAVALLNNVLSLETI
ncbi:transcription-repair coupling factor [uncultured Muribaculum sp.]|jgi:transcription-repair coupling factor (superfamily II helicase)|uniref:transcription-repair coupling factor n=3 Tax=uncultured Muribaculum sp. TaxID=1918613 RepID=UPI000F4A8549|nr:transcription-repair coupling factor [uncultured Muribaculum sp.]ROT15882.1 transcription-repair coupling factor [Muribaculaceae bacterium Isolate-102 (HZI)]